MPNLWISLLILILTIASYCGVFYGGVKYEESTNIESQYKGLVSYAEVIKNAVEQNDQDTITIANLRNQLTRVQYPSLKICTGTSNTDEASRLLSERVDEEFARLQKRAGELFFEADEINIDAIRANSINSRR